MAVDRKHLRVVAPWERASPPKHSRHTASRTRVAAAMELCKGETVCDKLPSGAMLDPGLEFKLNCELKSRHAGYCLDVVSGFAFRPDCFNVGLAVALGLARGEVVNWGSADDDLVLNYAHHLAGLERR